MSWPTSTFTPGANDRSHRQGYRRSRRAANARALAGERSACFDSASVLEVPFSERFNDP